jgi:hypothetical protein
LNNSIPRHSLSLEYAETNEFIPSNAGLLAPRDSKGRAYVPGTGDNFRNLIPFNASTSADAKLMGVAGTKIWDLTLHLNSSSASVSAGDEISVSADSLPAERYGWAEFNKSLILVSPSASCVRYTTALGKFEPWSATASGDSIHNMWGVGSYKSRLYVWPKTEPKFYYGGTNAVQGTFNPFDLAPVAPGSSYIVALFGLTRDGGAGPDDFATFIMDDGKVVIYKGSDPEDSNWALVGRYQIGKPFGRRCAVAAGAEHYVLCKDDIYILPQDLQGKRTSTNFVDKGRVAPITGVTLDEIDGAFNPQTGRVLWEDGTVIVTNLPGAPGYKYQHNLIVVASFKGREFFSRQAQPGVTDDALLAEHEALGTNGNPIASQITSFPTLKTAPIPTNSRTNISLYNPIFDHTSGISDKKIKFRSCILYDYSASADWVTATASGDSTGIWMPGFGTGRAPQIVVEIVSTSVAVSENVIFRGIDLTLEETGGL